MLRLRSDVLTFSHPTDGWKVVAPPIVLRLPRGSMTPWWTEFRTWTGHFHGLLVIEAMGRRQPIIMRLCSRAIISNCRLFHFFIYKFMKECCSSINGLFPFTFLFNFFMECLFVRWIVLNFLQANAVYSVFLVHGSRLLFTFFNGPVRRMLKQNKKSTQFLLHALPQKILDFHELNEENSKLDPFLPHFTGARGEKRGWPTFCLPFALEKWLFLFLFTE